MEWCIHWKNELVKHQLMGTGTTGSKVAEETGLDVEILHSGPFGGDQQIGAKICEQKLDILILETRCRPHCRCRCGGHDREVLSESLRGQKPTGLSLAAAETTG